MSSPAQQRFLRASLVLIVTAAVWSPSLINDYVLDDNTFVRSETPYGPNPMVRELRPLAEYFTRPYGYQVADRTRGYRPVTVLGFALTHAAARRPVAGEAGNFTDPPWPHHALNVALQVVSTALVYAMARRLLEHGPALVAALVFGVHALHAEAVASIVGRAELSSFVFGACAALAWLRGVAAAGAVRVAWLGLSALSLFLALGSKESALAWIAFAPLFVFVALRKEGVTLREASRRVLAGALGCGVALGIYLILRTRMLAEIGAAFEAVRNPIFAADWDVRARTGVMVLAYGLSKLAWPFELVSDYGARVFEPVLSWLDVRWLSSALALAALAAGGWIARRSAPALALAATVFLTWGVVISNVLVPIETIFAERLYYTPVLAVSFVLAWAWQFATGCWRLLLQILVAVWLAANAWKSVDRSREWRDTATLIRTDAERQPRSVWLAVEAARWYRDQGDEIESERHLRRALALEANYAPALVALFEMRMRQGLAAGDAEQREHALDEAVTLGRQALEADALEPLLEQKMHQNLAVALADRGRLDEAIAEHEAVLEIDAASEIAQASRVELAWLLHERGAELEELAALVPAKGNAPPGFEAMLEGLRGMRLLERGESDAARALLAKSIVEIERVSPRLLRIEMLRAWASASIESGKTEQVSFAFRRYLSQARMPTAWRAEIERSLSALESRP